MTWEKVKERSVQPQFFCSCLLRRHYLPPHHLRGHPGRSLAQTVDPGDLNYTFCFWNGPFWKDMGISPCGPLPTTPMCHETPSLWPQVVSVGQCCVVSRGLFVHHEQNCCEITTQISRPGGAGEAVLGGGNSLWRARLESRLCHLSVCDLQQVTELQSPHAKIGMVIHIPLKVWGLN